MRKTIFLFVSLFITANFAWALDAQDDLQEKLKGDGVILVRNDKPFEPLEIHINQKGRHLLCLTNDLTRFNLYTVGEYTFKSGQTTALVRCINGLLDIGNGYI